MMNYIDKLLAELSSRLPELEWKIGSIKASISSHNVPRGLFRASHGFSGQTCVDEIKADIQALSLQLNQRSANYLATRITQKINVLVTLCQIQSKRNKSQERVHFGLSTITTRQQWISTLEHSIQTLESQKQSMINALAQFKKSVNDAAVLNLQAELGEVERRLTLAKETLNQAIA